MSSKIYRQPLKVFSIGVAKGCKDMKEVKKVPFLDLKAQFVDLQKAVLKGVESICKNAEFVLGSAVSEFEENFSSTIFGKAPKKPKEKLDEAIEELLHSAYNKNHCVGVGNGTDALQIALKALDLPPHSEVLIPANTYFACAEAVLNAGLNLAIIDCDENGEFIINKENLSPKSSAFIAVHLYGKVLDLDKLRDFAKENSLAFVEDCAQAHGGVDKQGRSVGSVGDIATFSFYPGKNLGAYGDGGAVLSKDINLVKKARQIANHGQEYQNDAFVKNHHIALGYNSRLDSIQAKILTIKLPLLETHNEYRTRAARRYYYKLESLEKKGYLKLPPLSEQCVWHLFVIEWLMEGQKGRDSLCEFLQKNGIECSIHYPNALSDIEVLRSDERVRVLPTTNASRRAKTIISLPMGEHLRNKHIEYISDKIEAFIKK